MKRHSTRLSSSPLYITNRSHHVTPSSPLSLPTRPLAFIPDEFVDASLYSKFQLHHIHKYFPAFFLESMSFSRVCDTAIYELIDQGLLFAARWMNTDHVCIPINAKKTGRDLKEFFVLGNKQQKEKSKEDELISMGFLYREPTATFCLGIDTHTVYSGCRSDDR